MDKKTLLEMLAKAAEESHKATTTNDVFVERFAYGYEAAILDVAKSCGWEREAEQIVLQGYYVTNE